MLIAALRDLQWRRRRFAITIVGTALVFAMSLLMSGLANAFTVEIGRTLDDQGAVVWLDVADVPGPFAPGPLLTPADVEAMSEATDASLSPVLFAAATAASSDGEVLNVNVMGVEPGQLGAPTAVEDGTTDLGPGSVIVPVSMGYDVGEELGLSGVTFDVVGVVEKASLVAGAPTVFLDIDDARRAFVVGQPLSSMLLSATPVTPPDGYRAFSRDEVADDLGRPLANPVSSINFVKFLLWAVAGLIVASIVYLTVLERTRDIAVFKATGSSTAAIGAGICLQAVVIAALASLVGMAVASLLAPRFPMDVQISTTAMATLPLTAVTIGVLSGLVGVRRTAGVEPAAAFGGP